MNGKAAMNGAARMRPAVIVFGRFTRPPSLRQRLQHQLADGLECIEYSVTSYRDSIEVGRTLDPFTAGQLVDQIFARVIRIRRDVKLGRVLDFPPGIERRLQLGDRSG